MCNPPFRVPRDVVARLTPEFISEVYFCRRDKDGNVVPEQDEETPEPTLKDLFFESRRGDGLRDYQIEPLWRRHLADNPRLAEWLGEDAN